MYLYTVTVLPVMSNDDPLVLVILAEALSTATVLIFTVSATTVVLPVALQVFANVGTDLNVTLKLRIGGFRHVDDLANDPIYTRSNWLLLHHLNMLHLALHLHLLLLEHCLLLRHHLLLLLRRHLCLRRHQGLTLRHHLHWLPLCVHLRLLRHHGLPLRHHLHHLGHGLLGLFLFQNSNLGQACIVSQSLCSYLHVGRVLGVSHLIRKIT